MQWSSKVKLVGSQRDVDGKRLGKKKEISRNLFYFPNFANRFEKEIFSFMAGDDRYLVEKLKRGSYDAFTKLYEKYSSHLFGFVLTALKSRSQAADIVQEVFIRIWENRLMINPELSFKSFIFTIANNLIVSEYRKQINRPELMEYLDFTNSIELADDPVSAKIEFDEFMERLKRAKLQLPPRQLQIFEMIKECGMTSTEVAERLGISEQVVRNQLSLSLKTLKTALADSLPLFLLFFS